MSKLSVSVNIAVYNESFNIIRLVDALLSQTRIPDEIIIVDDGSNDETFLILSEISSRHPLVQVFRQANAGPAAARNHSWRKSKSDICLFTDGDCVPQLNWLERIIIPFESYDIGAAGGTYYTLNSHNLLANFIGLEIYNKYSKVSGFVDAHGSYNLAIRRCILLEMGGFDESYRFPSGEDWDLTYRISYKYNILFVPDAIVGHFHPANIKSYLINQFRRGIDRVKLYTSHPGKAKGDSYTPWHIKYNVILSGMFLLLLFASFFNTGFLFVALPLLCVVMLPILKESLFFFDKSIALGSISILVMFLRNFSWFFGLCVGALQLIVSKVTFIR